MKWILFTGTWRLTNEEVEKDVRSAAREVIERGDGIVTGGATGVDYFAMDESMKVDPTASYLRVIIPANLQSYCSDYHTNWCNTPVTTDSINELEALLRKIQAANPGALIEMPHDIITQDHYDLRHDEEVKISDEVYAFQVNNSTGTQDTIDKASRAGLPITLHKKYSIETKKSFNVVPYSHHFAETRPTPFFNVHSIINIFSNTNFIRVSGV